MMAAVPGLDSSKVDIPKTRTPDDMLTSVLNFAYLGAGIVCVIILVIAGSMYITAAGDPGKISGAKKAIVGSISGLVFVILAFAITQFVLGAF